METLVKFQIRWNKQVSKMAFSRNPIWVPKGQNLVAREKPWMGWYVWILSGQGSPTRPVKAMAIKNPPSHRLIGKHRCCQIEKTINFEHID